MKILRGKLSQEEMVGFVLIVVLVTIIALVFLAISIRKSPEKLPSAEIESFIQSAMKYSSDCYSSAERRLDLKDLIKACSNKEKCMDDRETCIVLNETLTGMLRESWKPGISSVKSYKLEIYEGKLNRTIIKLEEGICTGNIAGTSILVFSDIKAEFEICS